MTNESLSHVYTGVTSNLARRVDEHRTGLNDGYTKRYRMTRLVYYEVTDDVRVAIAREKEIKGWRRSKKADLVRRLNPKWRDLSEELFS